MFATGGRPRRPVDRSTPILADPAPPRTRNEHLNPGLRAALIGYGAWGANVARNAALLDGCRLTAIADRSAARARQARRDHPGIAVVGDGRHVVRDPAIDAVLIATPAGAHFDLALAALEAGKHVFVEKPMTATSGEARALVDASARRNRVLMVDHTYVFSPAVRAISAALAAGAIGRSRSYASRRFNAGRVRGDAVVHWDLASHDLAILDYLFGSGPSEVAATRLDGRSTGRATGVRITLAYPGGFAATLESNWIAPAKTRRVTILGTGGRIDYDDLATKRRIVVRSKGRRAVVPPLDAREPLHAALVHFVHCIEGREPPLAGGRAGLDVVRLLEAADRSLARGGQPVRVENEAEAA